MMMNYEKMSDFEINMHVAKRVFAESIVDYEVNPFPDGCSMFSFETDKSFSYFDGCNNPSDAMPILIEMKIGFKWVNGRCTASSVMRGYHESTSNNPLRAAMIVFLMMQEPTE